MEHAHRLASFCIEEVPERMTPAVRDAARRLLLDFCGVALAGSTLPASDMLRRAVLPHALADAGATVIGTAETAAPPMAALLNGASAHSIELDDVHTAASLHAGAIVFPAALAAAQAIGCTGERFVESVVAGYEAMVRVGLWLTPSALFARQFHPTGVCGAYGAAAAVGLMAGLKSEGLARAFGIASDLAVGLMDFGVSGSWSKRLHTGWPAHGGYLAARMAVEGFKGSPEIFTSPAGVLFAFSGFREPRAPVAPRRDERLAIEQIAIKRHACCRFAHAALDALLDARAALGLHSSGDIERVRIGLFRDGMFLGEPASIKRAPATMVDAQFSMHYAAAVALARGRTSLPEFRDETLGDREIRALLPRIEVEHVPALDPLYPATYPARIEIVTRDGRRHAEERHQPVGDHDRPLGETELHAKFETLAATALRSERVRSVAEAVAAIERSDGPARLAEALRGDRASR